MYAKKTKWKQFPPTLFDKKKGNAFSFLPQSGSKEGVPHFVLIIVLITCQPFQSKKHEATKTRASNQQVERIRIILIFEHIQSEGERTQWNWQEKKKRSWATSRNKAEASTKLVFRYMPPPLLVLMASRSLTISSMSSLLSGFAWYLTERWDNIGGYLVMSSSTGLENITKNSAQCTYLTKECEHILTSIKYEY